MFSRYHSVGAPSARLGSRNAIVVVLAAALGAGGSQGLRAQNQPTVHWTNSAVQDAVTVLNGGGSFVTSFKGANDLTIKLLAGNVSSVFSDAFGGAYTYNNPWYVTGFVGVSTNGTGDGVAGDLRMLETSVNASATMSLQFDFSAPLTPRDHILVADVDSGEEYALEAFVWNGHAYSQVSLTNWGFLNCAGHTQQLPDITWPVWNANTGVLKAPFTLNLLEPLSILTPAQNIDRIVFLKHPVGLNGSAYIQFLTEPQPAGMATLSVQADGVNALVSWPQASSNLTLYSSTTLDNDWLPVTNNPPVLSGGSWVITNTASDQQRFYRLQWP